MKETEYNLGLVSVSFRKIAPEEILSAARDAGLSCIEWGSDVHAPCKDTERLYELVELQKKYGITCSSYGTYFRFLETPIEELTDYINAAKILGTDILRLWCGRKNGEGYTEDEKKELFAQCRAAADIAEREGVTLCLECHKNTYTERLEDALELMEAIHSPHFRMYWQPFQWKEIEDNLAYAEQIAPYACHIHVFQWKDKLKLPLRDGMEEWRGYLSKFSVPRTLLLEFMPDGNLSTLKTEAATLKTIVGGEE